MKIDISQEDFETLCINALRYCHGRMTYMPGLMQEIVLAHLKDLGDKGIDIILQDRKYQEDLAMWGDERIDKPGWMKFYEQVAIERVKRDNEAEKDNTTLVQIDEAPVYQKFLKVGKVKAE